MTAVVGRAAPIHIRVQCLEGMDSPGLAGQGRAFPAMPESGPAVPDAGRRRRGHWRERDLQRAIAAARRAGLSDYRVEIAPDGTIAIVVGQSLHKRTNRRHN